MTYDARQVANWFVNKAKSENKILSIMSLLKLTYITHGWHLETQDSPLFKDRIEAWQYGPVIPVVYNEFKQQGKSVSRMAEGFSHEDFGESDTKLLEDVWKIYSSLSSYKLSDITHVEGGPWDIATKTGGYYAKIPNDLIKQHYVLKRSRAKDVAA